MSRSFFAPEILQLSAMDCGPAALACLLRAFGVRVDLERLREAARTSLDGTSIDALQDVCLGLGVKVEQQLLPDDLLEHAFQDRERLPAILATRSGSGVHFVVLWRSVGGRVHVMDPARGRRWLTGPGLSDEAHAHVHVFEDEHELVGWFRGSAFDGALRRRAAALGASPELVEQALSGAAWWKIAALDAALRFVAKARREGVRDTDAVLRWALEAAERDLTEGTTLLPASFYSMGSAGPRGVTLRGALILAPTGREIDAPEAAVSAPRALLLHLTEPTGISLLRRLASVIGKKDLRALGAALALSFVLSLGAVTEVVLGRASLRLPALVSGTTERVGAALMLAAFLLVFLWLDLYNNWLTRCLGRGLDVRLRARLLEALPHRTDAFLSSRLASDMAERVHSLVQLTAIPATIIAGFAALVDMIGAVVLLCLIVPSSAVAVGLGGALAVALPIASARILSERELRARTADAACGAVFLDAFRGLAPIQSHGAQRTIRSRLAALLGRWEATSIELSQWSVLASALSSAASYVLTAAALVVAVRADVTPARMVLALFWSLRIASSAGALAAVANGYAPLRNAFARAAELLHEERGASSSIERLPASRVGVEIELRGVHVTAAGHEVLRDVSVHLRPGEHVAVVGPSGAGKSSLVGLLLGWHKAMAGQVLVDGAPLTPALQAALRPETAWVDPAVQLWNRALLDNLSYGRPPGSTLGMMQTLTMSDLVDVLERLDGGLGTPLGFSGARLSAGQGQRVRFARALQRTDARLVILDEAFRGLERDRRAALLERARLLWARATTIYVTHELDEAMAFDRVLVVNDGRIVQDGDPRVLATAPGLFGQMIRAEELLRAELWADPAWTKIAVRGGVIERVG